MPSGSRESAEQRRQRLDDERRRLEKVRSPQRGKPSKVTLDPAENKGCLVVGLAVVVALVVAVGIAGGSGGSGGSEDRPKASTTTLSPYDELRRTNPSVDSGMLRSLDELRRTNPSVDSGILRSLSRETSCEVLDAEWFTADALADLVRETYGRLSDNYQIAKAYKHAVSNRMDQVGC